jgi:hypothetical protein
VSEHKNSGRSVLVCAAVLFTAAIASAAIGGAAARTAAANHVVARHAFAKHVAAKKVAGKRVVARRLVARRFVVRHIVARHIHLVARHGAVKKVARKGFFAWFFAKHAAVRRMVARHGAAKKAAKKNATAKNAGARKVAIKIAAVPDVTSSISLSRLAGSWKSVNSGLEVKIEQGAIGWEAWLSTDGQARITQPEANPQVIKIQSRNLTCTYNVTLPAAQTMKWEVPSGQPVSRCVEDSFTKMGPAPAVGKPIVPAKPAVQKSGSAPAAVKPVAPAKLPLPPTRS